MTDPILHGMASSVYVRIARLAAHEKGVALEQRHLDPFAESGVPPWYLALNPFGKIPTLQHGELTLYETGAIVRYLDEAFDGPPLQLADPPARARMAQIMGIVDSYAYRPMVWGLYVALAVEPQPPAADLLEQAVAASQRVLDTLEDLAVGPWLLGDSLTLADCHLAPVVRYLTEVRPGRELLAARPRIRDWWQACYGRDAWLEILNEVGPEGSREPPG